MQIEFSGAAREVTGSCHIVRPNGKTILLDCGLYQGKRKEAQEKNLRLPLPVEEIDAVVLSHAHIDHAGRLPFLVAQGYDKRIWATAATRDLCAYMLADSAHIQEMEASVSSQNVGSTFGTFGRREGRGEWQVHQLDDRRLHPAAGGPAIVIGQALREGPGRMPGVWTFCVCATSTGTRNRSYGFQMTNNSTAHSQAGAVAFRVPLP